MPLDTPVHTVPLDAATIANMCYTRQMFISVRGDGSVHAQLLLDKAEKVSFKLGCACMLYFSYT
jgi:hypothetical protein